MSRGMSTEDYLKHHEGLCERGRALSCKKNNDYAAPDAHADDPMRVFRNFVAVEKLGICSAETGFLVRLTDKFTRLINLTDPEHTQMVADESIEDTEVDIINYICLLSAYRKNKRQQKTERDK